MIQRVNVHQNIATWTGLYRVCAYIFPWHFTCFTDLSLGTRCLTAWHTKNTGRWLVKIRDMHWVCSKAFIYTITSPFIQVVYLLQEPVKNWFIQEFTQTGDTPNSAVEKRRRKLKPSVTVDWPSTSLATQTQETVFWNTCRRQICLYVLIK